MAESQIENKFSIVKQRILTIQQLPHEKGSPSKIQILQGKLEIMMTEIKSLMNGSLEKCR